MGDVQVNVHTQKWSLDAMSSIFLVYNVNLVFSWFCQPRAVLECRHSMLENQNVVAAKQVFDGDFACVIPVPNVIRFWLPEDAGPCSIPCLCEADLVIQEEMKGQGRLVRSEELENMHACMIFGWNTEAGRNTLATDVQLWAFHRGIDQETDNRSVKHARPDAQAEVIENCMMQLFHLQARGRIFLHALRVKPWGTKKIDKCGEETPFPCVNGDH